MFSALKHCIKLLVRTDYRREYFAIAKLKSTPRFVATQTDLLGPTLQVADSASILFMYQEIFKDEIYRFESENPRPVIVDCGANIGLSVIYFKRLYPDCVITAFEPDKKIFEILAENIQSCGLQGMELINKALWNIETELEFMSEGADGGRLGGVSQEHETINVSTARLSDYLQQDVDFLKIDIEGAETAVLEECQPCLHRVRRLFVEYHSFAAKDQTLHVILDILYQSGFRYHIHHISKVTRQPFMHRNVYGGMDLQLNIYAYRDA